MTIVSLPVLMTQPAPVALTTERNTPTLVATLSASGVITSVSTWPLTPVPTMVIVPSVSVPVTEV